MTTERLLEIFEAFRQDQQHTVPTDELVDAAALAYERDDGVLSFVVGFELGRRRWVPTAAESARLRIRDRT
jgi:hypothetical protein